MKGFFQKDIFKKDMSRRAFWIAVVLVVLAKLAVSRFQMIWVWVDGAPIDDELMFRAAQSISAGQWLGEYDWLTLSKHMFFAVWLALCNALHIPYLAAGQLLACGGALASALAFAPVLRRYKSRFLVFALLAFNPAVSASFTLRVYRDNIFPALCMFFFAGLCGWALRWRGPLAKGLPWLGMSGLGLALAWLTREDGMWLLPFAAAGSLILLITALRAAMPLAKKLARCAALAVPFALLAAGILAFSAVNYAYYGVFTVSDFSSGGFSAAMGAMMRVEAGQWQPLVSVNAEARQLLYEKVPALAPWKSGWKRTRTCRTASATRNWTITSPAASTGPSARRRITRAFTTAPKRPRNTGRAWRTPSTNCATRASCPRTAPGAPAPRPPSGRSMWARC